MTTFPAIILNPRKNDIAGSFKPLKDEIRAVEETSLYAPFSKPFKLDLDQLYRRDNNELIKPFLNWHYELATVAQRIDGYFKHGEAKSRGSIGLLKRKCVAGLTKVWIGKESHPLADTDDMPDDETLEAYPYRAKAVIIPGAPVNTGLIKRAGIAEVSESRKS